MALIQLDTNTESLGKKSLIRHTQSICPDCNKILPADVFERDSKVFMSKVCPEHGEVEELYYGSYEMYQKFSTYWQDGKGTHAPNIPMEKCACPTNCGLCSSHLSHTGLGNMIVTNRCDLTCWYCFFYVKKGLEGSYVYEPSLDQVREMARTLRGQRPVPGNSLQITGGEPTLREELPEIINIIREEGVEHIQLNTNGINLALKPELATTLRKAGVSNLYMSYDGVTARTNPKNHWEAPVAIDSCRKAGLGVVLVPTVIKSINDHELGDILNFARSNIDIVRAISYQPVSLTGRMKKQEREKYRITIPDCIDRLEEQTNGELTRDDWFPVPSCSPITNFIEAFTKKPQYELSIHFACGAGTYVFEDAETKRLVPMTSFVDLPGLLEFVDERTDELNSGTNRYVVSAKILSKISSFINKKKQPSGLDMTKMLVSAVLKHDYSSIGQFHLRSMFLGMMHFQDKYNQDEERLQRCDIHYVNPDLRIIPFCSFNVIPEWYRDRIQKKYGMTIEEWEKHSGEKLEAKLYKGTLRRGQKLHQAGEVGCATQQVHIEPITGT
ncbi:MAG: tetraether lipid synthase Tes [Nitrososphaerales archaeon]